MKRRTIIALVLLIIAAIISAATLFFLFSQNNIEDTIMRDSSDEEQITNSDSNDSTSYNATGKYSSTTEDISNENPSSANGLSNSSSEEVKNIPIESHPSAESVRMNDKLMKMDVESMKQRAYDIVFKLRNFDTQELSNSTAWVGKFSSSIDSGKASQNSDKNILYQESLPRWASTSSTYSEYKNKTRSIDYINMYMEPNGTEEIPVVALNVVEESNADYPLRKSEHWKPINVVSSTYLVYFTQDGGLIYSVKSVDKQIIEKNIYNYPYDEESARGEGTYYTR